MTRYDARFKILGNDVDVSVFADDEQSAFAAIERHYGFFDDGSFSMKEKKEDDQESPIAVRR